MQIEVGKSYRTRDGRKAKISHLGPWGTAYNGNVGNVIGYWRPNGECITADRNMDLIAPWEEPVVGPCAGRKFRMRSGETVVIARLNGNSRWYPAYLGMGLYWDALGYAFSQRDNSRREQYDLIEALNDRVPANASEDEAMPGTVEAPKVTTPLPPQVGDKVTIAGVVKEITNGNLCVEVDGELINYLNPACIASIEPRKPCVGDVVAWDMTSSVTIVAIDGDKWWCRLAFGQDAIWSAADKMALPGFRIVSRASKGA